MLVFVTAINGQTSQPPPPCVGKDCVHQGQGIPQQKNAGSTYEQRGTKDHPLFTEQITPQKTEAETAEDERQKQEKTKAEGTLRLFNEFLIGVGSLQGLVMIFQLIVLNRQTYLIEKQANISMNSERSLLAEEIRFASDMPLETPSGLVKRTVAVVTLHNHGRTPAELVSVEIRFIALKSSEELPKIPDYGTKGDFLIKSAKGIRVTPEGTRMFLRYYERSETLSDEEIISVYKDSMRLYCFGRIIYRDVFGRDQKLQFCQRYREAAPGAPSFVSGFQSDGPPAYNETT